MVDLYWEDIKVDEKLLADISILDIKRGLNLSKITTG